MLIEEKVNLLRNTSFLKDIPCSVLEELASCATLVNVPALEVVVEKGAHGSTMYCIVEGSVRVHDGDIVLAQLEAGQVFGEISLLDSGERSATVTTESPSQLLVLDKDDVHASLSRETDALFSIIRTICRRERHIICDLTRRGQKVLAFEKELEIGRKIQANFLPDSLPKVDHWDIACYFKAAREVAGDFYDAFTLKDGVHLAIVIGDVCDKGVGAALFMTLFRTLIRASCLHGGLTAIESEAAPLPPETLLLNSVVTTNRYIATTHRNSSMFASMFFAIVNTQTGHLSYVNGGHEPAMLFRVNGTVDLLDTTGPVLGLFPGVTFNTGEATLEIGDVLLTYTDGVPEAKNAHADQYTEKHLLEVAQPVAQNVEQLLSTILDDVSRFVGHAPQHDDITMLAVKRLDARGT